MTQVVPFTRELKSGMKGRDVLAVKRALIRQGVLKQKLKDVTNVYGRKTESAVKTYQKNHKPLQPTGRYTKAVHSRLVGGKNFDAYGAKLMRDAKAAQQKQPAQAAGQRIASAALYAHGRKPRHYTQGGQRWQPVERAPRWKSNMWSYGDCSSFATGCFKQAGIKNDPNGYGWRAGYTGTLCQHGKAVSVKSVQPGDLLFYGSGPPWDHVTVAVSKDRCVSHGSEGGPHLLANSYRPIGQARRYV